MEKIDLSVIITSRNEEFLSRTVEGVLNSRDGSVKTNVIVFCDGNWPSPSINDHPDVIIAYKNKSVGQRAGLNEAIRLSTAEFVMKLDAHCILDKGFDKVLVEDGRKLGKNVTQIPRMYNLHAFDWKCNKCGNRWYQSPKPTHCMLPGEKRQENKNCDSQDFERVMVWKPRFNRKSDHYRFDKDLHFQYWGSLGKRPGFEGDISETMSLLGACFFMDREFYWKIGGSDEEHGSWGQQGTEISCKTWLSGGRLVTNKKTWFSHLFRTQGDGFGFPYPQSGSQINHARKYSQDLWKNNKWEGQTRDFQWIIDKFSPIPGWHDDEKGIIYYTDNKLRVKIAKRVQRQIKKASGGKKIVSSSLKPMDFGDKNVITNEKRGWSTMNKQILKALKAIKTDIIFFCEHDVMYHPSHFDFTPKRTDRFYYNTNVWKVRADDGHAVRTKDCKQLSGLVCYKKLAIKHFEKRLKMLESYKGEKFDKYVRKIGFEPGTHSRDERVDDYKAESFESRRPNVDIRHGNNATATRWSPEQFRNKKYTQGWTETKDIPGWGEFEKFFGLIK